MEKNHLEEIYRQGLRAVLPEKLVPPCLEGLAGLFPDSASEVPPDCFTVIGAGKAAGTMAEAVESLLGDRVTGGLVVMPDGAPGSPSIVKTQRSGHPHPDGRSVEGARAILDTVVRTPLSEAILVLISGGASSLICLPAEGLSLVSKSRISSELMARGAGIHELNTVRKHLSGIKGGRLLQAMGGRVSASLIISDVSGDRVEFIGSGPTAADSTSYRDALAILEKYGISSEEHTEVYSMLAQGVSGTRLETLRPDDPLLLNHENRVIGNNANAVVAAAKHAESLGYETVVLESPLDGDVGDCVSVHLREIIRARSAMKAQPFCLISGGEVTVKSDGGADTGRGGRCQHLALTFALELREMVGVRALFAGTDGIDGCTDAAGAFVDVGTWSRAIEAGLNPQKHLDRFSSYELFRELDDLLVTGHTGTNVMDLRAVLIDPL